eukprot:GHRR01021343.1.p1 GENE.GHRR01021343.1~~GHRR01021343.1.p1  ORF type:complete len:660 (+),score=249.56 GHRR01021343.1:75-2054(+)
MPRHTVFQLVVATPTFGSMPQPTCIAGQLRTLNTNGFRSQLRNCYSNSRADRRSLTDLCVAAAASSSTPGQPTNEQQHQQQQPGLGLGKQQQQQLGAGLSVMHEPVEGTATAANSTMNGQSGGDMPLDSAHKTVSATHPDPAATTRAAASFTRQNSTASAPTAGSDTRRLDIRFTSVEARVKGGPIMVRPDISSSRRRVRVGSSTADLSLDNAAAAALPSQAPSCVVTDITGKEIDDSNSSLQTAINSADAAHSVASSDAWSVDAAVKPRKPSWQFRPVSKTARTIDSTGLNAWEQSHGTLMRDLELNFAQLRPRQGLGVLRFDLPVSMDAEDGGGRASLRRMLRQKIKARRPEPGSYDIDRAWAYLAQHVPSVLLTAASHQAQQQQQQQQLLSKGSPGDGSSPGDQRAVLHDLSRALQHVRPRVPAWGFAPLPTVMVTQQVAGRARFQLCYDVQMTLVRRRTPGGVPFQLQLSRPVQHRLASASATIVADAAGITATPAGLQPHLGPGSYSPSYTLVERALARLLVPFGSATGSNSSSRVQKDPAAAATVVGPREGDVLDLNVAAAFDVLTQNRGKASNTVIMRLMLGRDEAAAAVAAAVAAAPGAGGSGVGFGKLTSQLSLPNPDVDVAVRRRVPEVPNLSSAISWPAHSGEAHPTA